MKMKKWLALFLAILMIFCTTACDSIGKKGDSDDSEAAGTPLLYRVTDDEGNVVWLFGTIHVGEKSYYPLPDYITDAFENCDGLAVEFDIVAAEKNAMDLASAQAKCMYSLGDSIQNHIPSSLYKKAVSEMKDLGVYSAVYDMYIPAMWSSVIDQAKRDKDAADYGVDRHMIEWAYDLDLPVYDIESADLQYGMLASFSEDLQIMLLESSLERSKKEYQKDLKKLMDMWQNGDYEGLREYVSAIPDELDDEEQELYEEYLEKTLTDRDEGMTDFVIEALEDGDELFICVGAAHVVGVDGIIDQLEDAGYTVELVTE